MVQREIRIENARSHNLKGVSCRIPLRSLTVVTGVSGSGKSTLAFDTLFAEGQRRYVTSLSTYARQFLERMPRPDVDLISNLPPAIAIEQRNTTTNARSTVGTATEILDYLRLLFAKVGETRCPDCDLLVQPGSPSDVAERILDRWQGRRILVAAPLAEGAGEGAEELCSRLVREGFTRLLDPEGGVIDLTQLSPSALPAQLAGGLLLIDRLSLSGEAARGRLVEAVATAFARGHGRLVLVDADGGSRESYREGFTCDGCNRVFAEPTPALFSFNSPLGACKTCQGFGRVTDIDFGRVVPDPRLSIAECAIAPFATPMGQTLQRDLLAACHRLKIPVDTPFGELEPAHRELVFEGDAGDWYGVRGFFDWLQGRRYKVQARTLIARYRRFDPCPDCRGARLCAQARWVRVAGRDLGEVSRDSIRELAQWLEGLELRRGLLERASRLLSLLRTRVNTVVGVGLGYVSLDRQVRTLSGGEVQRIQLATALGGSLTAVLYVLDEPSIGLHPRDMERLLYVLRSIRDQGNTVVVVEHAPEIVAAADHVIDLGPGGGHLGGRLVIEGSVEEIRAHQSSLTARVLRGEHASGRAGARPRARKPRGRLRIVGACENNLQNLTVELPLGQLVAVTGVSGAGKSTLVRSVLVGNLLAELDRRQTAQRDEPGACHAIEGVEQIRRVALVEQRPVSRSPRSNCATVSKAFDAIRSRFAATREARARGVGPGWFSFNVRGGRCDDCEGAGEVVIDMQFLDDVRVPCEACGGLRYRREVQEVRLDGRSITDVLALTIDEAIGAFSLDRKIGGRLEPFSRVGLGYLALGQPISTLSGGEHQRVRLAQALAEEQRDTLFVLDEPTTGLHRADIEILLDCLDQLIEGGGSVIVVEHNLDVIRRADFVLDLGPGGGPEGGRVVSQGTPQEVARVRESHTGAALRVGSEPGS
jgi:excinuclease ABC subunit A